VTLPPPSRKGVGVDGPIPFRGLFSPVALQRKKEQGSGQVGKSVLLVDDNRVARMMMRLVIAELRPDWRVTEAQSGEDALALADTETFDILLLDVGLPGMSGLDVAQHMKGRFPGAAIAMVTANIQKPVRDRAASLDVAFIEKPLKPEALLRFFNKVEADHG
jgi:CheY-like chemotaxis protein